MVQVLVAVKLWWRVGARGCQVPRGAIFPELLKLKGLKIGVFIIFSCEINKTQNLGAYSVLFEEIIKQKYYKKN